MRILEKWNSVKKLQKINEDDKLVLNDFIKLYSSAQIDINSTRPKIETTYPFKICMNESICSLLSSGRWNELNICAFRIVKYHNFENLVFQQLPVEETINNSYENNRFGEVNEMRNGIITDSLTSVETVEKAECGCIILEVFEGFLCYNLEHRTYTELLLLICLKQEIYLNLKEKIHFKTKLKRLDCQSTVVLSKNI